MADMMRWEFRVVFVGPARRPRWIWVRKAPAGERSSSWFLTYEACLRDAMARGYVGGATMIGRAASEEEFSLDARYASVFSDSGERDVRRYAGLRMRGLCSSPDGKAVVRLVRRG